MKKSFLFVAMIAVSGCILAPDPIEFNLEKNPSDDQSGNHPGDDLDDPNNDSSLKPHKPRVEGINSDPNLAGSQKRHPISGLKPPAPQVPIDTQVVQSTFDQPLSQETLSQIFDLLNHGNQVPREIPTTNNHPVDNETLIEKRRMFIDAAKNDPLIDVAQKYLDLNETDSTNKTKIIGELLEGVSEVLSNVHKIDRMDEPTVEALRGLVARIYKEEPILVLDGATFLNNKLIKLTESLFRAQHQVASQQLQGEVKIDNLFSNNLYSKKGIDDLESFMTTLLEKQYDFEQTLEAISAQKILLDDQFKIIQSHLTTNALFTKLELIEQAFKGAVQKLKKQKLQAFEFAVTLGTKLELAQNELLWQDYLLQIDKGTILKQQIATETDPVALKSLHQALEENDKLVAEKWDFFYKWMSDVLPEKPQEPLTDWQVFFEEVKKRVMAFFKDLANAFSQAKGCFDKVQKFFIAKGKFEMLKNLFQKSSTSKSQMISNKVFHDLATRLLNQQKIELLDPKNQRCVLMNDQRNTLVMEIQSFINTIRGGASNQKATIGSRDQQHKDEQMVIQSMDAVQSPSKKK